MDGLGRHRASNSRSCGKPRPRAATAWISQCTDSAASCTAAAWASAPSGDWDICCRSARTATMRAKRALARPGLRRRLLLFLAVPMPGVLAIDAAVTYRMALADGPIDIAPYAPGHSSGRGHAEPNASQDGCHSRHATFRPPFRKPTKCARPGWLQQRLGTCCQFVHRRRCRDGRPACGRRAFGANACTGRPVHSAKGQCDPRVRRAGARRRSASMMHG